MLQLTAIQSACTQNMADTATLSGDPRWILPSGMMGILIRRLKSTYAQTNVDNCSKTVLEQYRKAELISVVMHIIENVTKFKQILTDLETTLNDYMVINSNHEEVTKKIVQKMADDTKVELIKCFPQSNRNQIYSISSDRRFINEVNNRRRKPLHTNCILDV